MSTIGKHVQQRLNRGRERRGRSVQVVPKRNRSLARYAEISIVTVDAVLNSAHAVEERDARVLYLCAPLA